VYPSVSHPANHGRICVRGWHVHEVASSADRLRTPLIRKNGTLVPASFEEAYDLIARRLGEIRKEYGPAAIGMINSARCSNEDGYLFQKFARSVIGTNNIDQGTSYYLNTTVEALISMLGMAGATSSINDLFTAKTILLNDIDIGQQLPTIGGHIIRARLHGAKLIVVGPRNHRLTEHADLFLNIKPDTECYLYAAMAKIIIDRGLVDLNFIRNRCENYDAFLAEINSFNLLMAARCCDIDLALIEQAAVMYAQNTPGMLLYPAGSENLGSETLHAMIDLVLLTGNLGKPGAGILPLAEHNNSQGGCDMGVMPHRLPGYVPVTDAAGRQAIERHWGAPIPTFPGLDATSMLAGSSSLRAIWLDRHNPVMSAGYHDPEDTMAKMDFIVLQNLFMTKTAEMAHVVLPLAAYGEEDVTFTSTERRIQLAAKVVEPPSHLMSAWQQVVEVANRMGAAWNYPVSADVLAEIVSVVPDYTAVTHENLTRDYGRQWPCTLDRPLGTPFLYADARSSRKFVFEVLRPVSAETAVNTEYPFVLSYALSKYYWHKNTLVRHSETLKREYGILLLDYPDGFIEINDVDAKALGIRDGQKIKIVSPSGEALTAARVTPSVRRGLVSIPFFIRDIMKAIGWEESRVQHVQIAKAG
jgi:predicted molibdopterin-dependent oxidoreductase YjgC